MKHDMTTSQSLAGSQQRVKTEMENASALRTARYMEALRKKEAISSEQNSDAELLFL